MRRSSRRSFLGGAATLMGLPFLEALMPRTALGAETAAPRRLIVMTFPIGYWRAAWNYNQSLKPLADAGLSSDVLIATGINNGPANGPRGHTCGAGAFMTCKRVAAGLGGPPRQNVSMDQVVAQTLGLKSRFKSVELGTSILNEDPNKETGFLPVYKDHFSWDTPSTFKEKIIDPQKAFDRLFTGFSPTASSAEVERRKHYGLSVIDSVRDDAQRLQARLGNSDRQRLDQYLTGVRDLEVSIKGVFENAGQCAGAARPDVGALNLDSHIKVMIDLLAQAISCDVTRVASFCIENTVVDRTPPSLNIRGSWHSDVSHHASDPTKIANYVALNTYCVKQLAYLLTKLKTTTDIDGKTQLQNSLVFFSSELSDGDAHDHSNLPILIAGQAGGTVTTGRTVAKNGGKIANLFTDIMTALGVTNAAYPTELKALGVNVDAFGDDGSGPLNALA